MKFKIEANGTFTAKNILEAFLKVSLYYLDLHNELTPNVLLDAGFIRIVSVLENDDNE